MIIPGDDAPLSHDSVCPYTIKNDSASRTRLSFTESALIQRRILGALILREARTRFGDLQLGYIWAFLEPLCHIVVLSSTYAVLARYSPVGHSLVLFFVTGLIPYFLYDKTATRLGGAILANRALLNLPIVKNMDVILARALLEGGTLLIVLTFLLFALWLYGVREAFPHSILTLLSAAFSLSLLGLGIGTLNAVLNLLITSWDRIFRIATRPLYLLSCVFFVAEKTPSVIRDYLVYNPILHGVEWFRSAFYRDYGRDIIAPSYLLSWGIGTLLLGMLLERSLRRRLYPGP